MTSKSRTSWMRGFCCVLVSLGGAVIADERPRPLEAGEKVTVSFAMLETFASGATSEGHRFSQDLEVGQAMVGDAMRGHPFSFGVAGEPSGCASRSAVLSAESQLSRYPIGWSPDARVLEASTDQFVLNVSWKRLERGGDGRPIVAASEEIPEVSLREGERVLLDFVRTPGSKCVRSAALEVTAQLKEDPSLATRQIGYELWLVHETPNGARMTERSLLTASQGKQLPFAFPKEKLPAVASGGTADDRLQVTVTGHVRGRVRSDGAIDLSVGSERMLSYVAPDGSNDGGIGDGGEKIVRVRPGEAIRIEMPAPDQSPVRHDPRASRMTQDLAGHTFALIVTAKAL